MLKEKRPKSEKDNDDDIVEKVNAYKMFHYQSSSNVFHFYLTEEISSPSNYVDMCHQISMCGSNDVVYIHLNMPGGRLDAGVQIINALRTTQAHVVTVLESTAHSLGTLIFLTGDEFLVHDHCVMMFHNWSGGIVGKGNEQVAQLDATIKWFNQLARKLYVPFLSEQEVDKVLRGEDLWMQSAEIKKRLSKMSKMLKNPKKKEPKALPVEKLMEDTPS